MKNHIVSFLIVISISFMPNITNTVNNDSELLQSDLGKMALNDDFEYRIRIRGAFPSECEGEGDHYIASCMFEGDECDSNVQPSCFALPEENL
jgi:hypothetical protein